MHELPWITIFYNDARRLFLHDQIDAKVIFTSE